MSRITTILLLIFVFSGFANAQNDTIVSHTGDRLVGEIKSLEKGILTLETEYSDKDFNIEWKEIDQVKSSGTFLIILTDGRRLNGSIMSHPGDPPVVLISGSFGSIIIDDLLDVFFLKPVERNFIGRLDASIEIGYTFTKAQNHHQFTTRSNLGYVAELWGPDASLDIIRNVQDAVAETKRTDASLGFRTFFNNSWYLALSNNILQNDEQKLKLRSTTNLSFGHLLINTYRAYWSAGTGVAYNFESFTTDKPNEKSVEGLIVSELNLFAYEDLSLLTNLRVYPSFTVKGRIRSDFKFDLKYDLPLDFFIKVGFTNNFDNQPVEGASRNDYIIQTTFGWEL